MQPNNTLESLMNFGSSKESMILVAAPLGFLCLVAIIFTCLIIARRKREIASLDADLKIDQSAAESADAEDSTGDTSVLPGDNRWAKNIGDVEPEKEDTGEERWPDDMDQAESVRSGTKEQIAGDWLGRLKNGLDRTRMALQASLASIFSGNNALDDSTLERLHEVLYRADLGVEATDRLVGVVRKSLKGQDNPNWTAVKSILQAESRQIFNDVPSPKEPPVDELWVILVVGVNGVGKTTTIGKLAAYFSEEGMSVVLCAADTFRAAAIDQLKVWGQRIGVPVIAKQQGGDPAAVVFDAIASAKAKKADVLIIDTAGRLHSKSDLMDELEKIYRVIKREIPDAPHDAWLVIDATTGQNAFAQVGAFKETAKINGLIVTKLDGTAKGGVVLGICEQFKIPIRFLGVGEKPEDLNRFDASEFVSMLFK